MQFRQFTVDELVQISDAVGERAGWDFTSMVVEREPVPWDYEQVVAQYLTPESRVLDIGTGGGERLLRLSPRYRCATGVDPDPNMLSAATQNGIGVEHVTFLQASAEDLSPVADSVFDVVLTRHAPTVVPQINRVTHSGSYFICQNVGWNNMANVRAELATEPSRGNKHPGSDLNAHLEASGWVKLATAEYDVRYWVKDVESLIFWLKAIAGTNEVHEAFDVTRDHAAINRLIANHSTARGFATNEHRTLIIARRE